MRKVIIVLAAGLLVLAACGDDDDDTQTADTAVDDTVDDSDDTTADTSDDTIDEDAFAFTGEDCQRALQAIASNPALAALGQSDGDTDVDASVAYFEELAESVPDEIQEDFEILAGAYRDFADALEDLDFDPQNPGEVDPEVAAELQQLSAAFSEPDVQQASQNISDFFTENCSAVTTTTAG